VRLLSGILLGLLFAGHSLLEPHLPSGLAFTLQNSPTSAKYLPETMGGGVALFDYNNDGLLDVFFVNSGALTAPMSAPANFHRREPKYWNRLFRQNSDGTFTDVTEQAGLSQAGDANYGMGVAAADYDNDGFTDLFITSYGSNRLYRNTGHGAFTDVTAQAGVGGGGWSVSAGFFDLDNDGLLDLFVTRYLDWNFQVSKVCARQTYCPPAEFPKTTSLLYRNRGDGTFVDISVESGIAAHPGRALGVAFDDYDNDGHTDILVANDGMEQFLFHNEGNRRFTERALDSGVALSDDGKPFSGMGVDFRDSNNDGRPDIIITDLSRQVYAVYLNDGSGSFHYASQATGLATLSGGSSGWGVRWEDFDNDGAKDLFVAQSHVMDNIDSIDGTLHYKELPLLALNHDGWWERVATGVSLPVAARGAAFGDLNNDGASDVVVTVLGETPLFVWGRKNNNHWLTLLLQGRGGPHGSNRDALGAHVKVNGQWQTVSTAGSYVSVSDKRVHFGLGAAAHADIEVHWPSGIVQLKTGVPVDQFLTLTESDK
jgi:enediyne biosynthesis protein E4